MRRVLVETTPSHRCQCSVRARLGRRSEAGCSSGWEVDDGAQAPADHLVTAAGGRQLLSGTTGPRGRTDSRATTAMSGDRRAAAAASRPMPESSHGCESSGWRAIPALTVRGLGLPNTQCDIRKRQIGDHQRFLVMIPYWECCSGGDLLSHTLAGAVPSALKGLASGFGMGPGVSLSL